jgi:type IX secretion system PorP/SprF family membrane protein
MISAGASFSYGQRSVNFSKMSYPIQWDGFTFDKNNPNMENKGLEKSSYSSFAAGLNYALFPNELLYIKLGVGVANLNQPTETFWSGGENKLDIRPSANLDILMKTNEKVIINPSAYFSTQSGAREIMYGTLLMFNMAKPDEQIAANQLIFGAFHRWGDAVVGVAGIQRNGIRIMASYDYTISSLPVYAGPGTGALELSIRYEGLYGEHSKARPNYHCPRF